MAEPFNEAPGFALARIESDLERMRGIAAENGAARDAARRELNEIRAELGLARARIHRQRRELRRLNKQVRTMLDGAAALTTTLLVEKERGL